MRSLAHARLVRLALGRGHRRHRYIDSTSSPNVSSIAPRFSFCVAVSSPSSWSSSLGNRRNCLTCSTDAKRSFVVVDDLLDQLDDLRLLAEVAVRRVRQVVPQRPVADRLVLDADERGEVLAAVADDHRLLDVRRRLQAVLDLRRRDVLAARRDDDVLDAVDDLDVGRRRPTRRRRPCAASRRRSSSRRSAPACPSSRRTCRRAWSGSRPSPDRGASSMPGYGSPTVPSFIRPGKLAVATAEFSVIP